MSLKKHKHLIDLNFDIVLLSWNQVQVFNQTQPSYKSATNKDIESRDTSLSRSFLLCIRMRSSFFLHQSTFSASSKRCLIYRLYKKLKERSKQQLTSENISEFLVPNKDKIATNYKRNFSLTDELALFHSFKRSENLRNS